MLCGILRIMQIQNEHTTSSENLNDFKRFLKALTTNINWFNCHRQMRRKAPITSHYISGTNSQQSK